MTTPVSGPAGTGATAPPAPAVKAETLGQDAFMKLLVAQLKYQNPMAPADGQQYMTQMATFAQVEKLGMLVTAQTELATWQKRLSAEGMVGKQITGTASTAEGAAPVTGVVTGVRFDKTGPVLELAGGKTLAVDLVESVSQAPTTATTPSTTAPSTAPSTAPARPPDLPLPRTSHAPGRRATPSPRTASPPGRGPLP